MPARGIKSASKKAAKRRSTSTGAAAAQQSSPLFDRLPQELLELIMMHTNARVHDPAELGKLRTIDQRLYDAKNQPFVHTARARDRMRGYDMDLLKPIEQPYRRYLNAKEQHDGWLEYVVPSELTIGVSRGESLRPHHERYIYASRQLGRGGDGTIYAWYQPTSVLKTSRRVHDHPRSVLVAIGPDKTATALPRRRLFDYAIGREGIVFKPMYKGPLWFQPKNGSEPQILPGSEEIRNLTSDPDFNHVYGHTETAVYQITEGMTKVFEAPEGAMIIKSVVGPSGRVWTITRIIRTYEVMLHTGPHSLAMGRVMHEHLETNGPNDAFLSIIGENMRGDDEYRLFHITVGLQGLESYEWYTEQIGGHNPYFFVYDDAVWVESPGQSDEYNDDSHVRAWKYHW